MLFLTTLWQKEWVRYLVVLLGGVALGAVFYPTKSVEEHLSKKYEEQISQMKETYEKSEQLKTEEFSKTLSEHKEYKSESEKKIQTLTSEVRTLQSKQKTSYYKLIKPDGTIEVKKFSESEVNESSQVVNQIQEEFKSKVSEIETKWEEIHKKRLEEVKKTFTEKEEVYKHKIEELEKSKVTKINEKKFGVEVGGNTEKQMYVHSTGSLFGPVFLGVDVSSDKEFDSKSIGLGLGVSF